MSFESAPGGGTPENQGEEDKLRPNSEENPWEGFEESVPEFEEQSSEEFEGGVEGDNKRAEKYREIAQAAMKNVLKGGVLPAYLSIQALGLIAGENIDRYIKQGTEVVQAIKDETQDFENDAESLINGETIDISKAAFGYNIYLPEDDNLNFDDYEIFYDEDGHVVPRDIIYTRADDFSGTMNERGQVALAETTVEELQESLNQQYAELTAEIQVIEDEMRGVGIKEFTPEVVAKYFCGYLIESCRYVGDTEDPRGRWGKSEDDMQERQIWENTVSEYTVAHPEKPDTKYGSAFVLGVRNVIMAKAGASGMLDTEAYHGLIGGESNCTGMASAVALAVNNICADGSGIPVAFVGSVYRDNDDGSTDWHTITFFRTDEGLKCIDPTGEVASRRNLAKSLDDIGLDLKGLGWLQVKYDEGLVYHDNFDDYSKMTGFQLDGFFSGDYAKGTYVTLDDMEKLGLSLYEAQDSGETADFHSGIVVNDGV